LAGWSSALGTAPQSEPIIAPVTPAALRGWLEKKRLASARKRVKRSNHQSGCR
jgi:hypothetical protein